MSARRQASTTSLSKYARATSPDPSNRSLDFCNAFWGLGDGGVDVLFARMRGASRTTTELRAYWKERSSIEEDYAKRMAKLAKVTLGKDEIGELRNSLDTLRLETDKQASYHQNLAKQIRDDLEAPTANFVARQAHHKKTFQAAIEKKFKTKQQQEFHVNQAGEKYKSDCLRINSYTAQSTLMQGKELDKIHVKLERAQQTVQANERDYANFAKNLQTTVSEWEQDWKVFCDSCQDQEEERMEFIKDTMWAYANAVSTVCVSDDESCEKMRVALEQMEPDKDMENFVRDYGTGNAIPDPPSFVNYNNSEALPSGSSRPTSRPAQFPRASQRSLPPRQPPPPQEEEPFINTAGIGAVGRKGTSDSLGDIAPPARSQTQSRASNRGQSQVNGNGAPNGQGPAQPLTRRGTAASQYPPQGSFQPPNDPNAEPIDPTSKTMLKVGNNAYEVDPSKDPQYQQGVNRPAATPMQNGSVGDPSDPLLQKMTELKTAATSEGNVRRISTFRHNPSDSRGSNNVTRKPTTRGGPSLSPPSSSSHITNAGSVASPASRDYRNSAEVVVGSYPGSASRPSSPSPPTASFMSPPKTTASSDQVVDSVLADFHQSLPGERKSTSRSGSRRNSFVGAPAAPTQAAAQSTGQNLARPVSREGHVGIGAHGSQSRSNSPAPQPQPGPGANSRNSFISSPGSASGHGSNMGGSISQRTTSPNSVGIALDPSGKVAMDSMADRYRQQQQPQQPPQQQPQYSQPPSVSRNQNRLSGYQVPSNGVVPPANQPYTAAPPPPSVYPNPQQQPNYNQPAQARTNYPTQTPYTQPPPSHYPPPPPSQPVYQPQPQPGGGYSGPGMNGDLSRGPSIAGSYNSNSHLNAGPHPYTTGGRTPSPQPQPQQPQQQPQSGLPPAGFTEDGRAVLFYVKALYDYQATIEEEFDFQSGDVIAVTATPEDGWWSGELLDEARRQHGRHVFPSNFVCLF